MTPRMRDTSRMQTIRKIAGAVVLAATIAACSAKELDITNPNQATVAGASADPTALQLLATGLLADLRSGRTGYMGNVGILGRENYTFTPQEGRNTTNYLIGISSGGVQKLDNAGFVTAPWSGQYGVLRDVFNFKNTINAGSLAAAQKSAALGMAQTIEAIMLLEIVATHDSLGGITEIKANASELAPFVSRDSMYKYILNTLDAGAANLAAGGAAFPFTMAPGFAGFNTPTTFAQFNRAYKAKAASYYATAGGGATQWQAVLTALGASFLNAGATTRAAFDVGVYNTYAIAPDTPNGFAVATNTTTYAHMSFLTDAQLKANGQPDDRYTAKIRTGLPSRQGPVTSDGPTSAASTLGFSIWPAQNSSVAIIRNEELILIRAEAELATGAKAAAIADINIVRQNSGGLPASTLTAASSDDAVLLGILYEKRYSTMMEGNRWVDMRRYGKLALLPLDVTSGPNKNFVAKVIPVPQTECLVRAKATGDQLGPSGLNNCAQ
jgi:starch-binding outer membrane protein, SusD/RagB family